MRLRKAVIDFLSLLPIIILAISIMLGFYFGFQALSKPLEKMIEENAKQVLVVTPKGGTCQVAVIRQT